MTSVLRLLTACAAIVLVAAAPLDTAVISGSHPDGTGAYQIVVSSDGTASIAAAASAPKPFTLPAGLVARFFAAVAASHDDNWTSRSCAKASWFNFIIRVSWHGWVSGDITCSPGVHSAVELNNTVLAIVVLAGPPAAVPRSEIPPDERPPG